MFWNIVTTECPDRSVRRLRNILRTECCVVPVLPPEGPQNQQVRQGSPLVTAAGRRLLRAAVNPSTQHIPTTLQSRRARVPEGKSRKAQRPEGVRAQRPASSRSVCRNGGGAVTTELCVFGVSAVWPVGISAVWPVGVSALCRLDSRRVALPHFTR